MNVTFLPRISSMFFLAMFLTTIDLSLQQLQSLKDPESVPLGGTVTISCRYSTGVISDNNYPWWVQQRPGESPRLLVHQTSVKPSDVPARFSGSKSGNVMSLTITGALAEDEAIYSCSVHTGSEYVFGGGTQLTVTGQPPVSPSVQLFRPSEQEIKREKAATVVCLIDGFQPPAIKVQWKGDDKVIGSGVETTKASKQGDKYLASSYLRLGEVDYGKYETFTCEVTHEGKTIAKTVSKSGSC